MLYGKRNIRLFLKMLMEKILLLSLNLKMNMLLKLIQMIYLKQILQLLLLLIAIQHQADPEIMVLFIILNRKNMLVRIKDRVIVML